MLEENKFYWFKWEENGDWEIGKFVKERLWCCDGSKVTPNSCFKIDEKPIERGNN